MAHGKRQICDRGRQINIVLNQNITLLSLSLDLYKNYIQK